MLNRSLYSGLAAIQPPAHIQRTIERRGGRNPYGEPMYRLVRAEGRAIESWGLWVEYPRGTPIEMRNPDSPWSRAWRRVLGPKAAPLYPGEHSWVLERWRPAKDWGPESLWYLPKDQGGTMEWKKSPSGDGMWCPVAGPYPYAGDYTDAGFFLRNEELSESLVAYMIGLIEKALADLPPSPFQRVILALSAHEAAEQKKYDDYGKWCEEQLRDENPFDVWSLGARAEVHKMAERIGIRSQIW